MLAELDEVHLDVLFLVQVSGLLDDLLDQLDGAGDLLDRRVEREVEVEASSDVGPGADVLQTLGHDLGVGDRDQVAVEGADSSESKADRLDRTEVALEADQVAQGKGLVGVNRQRREQVLERVLGGQGHGQSDDAQPGQDRRQLGPEEQLHGDEGEAEDQADAEHLAPDLEDLLAR